MKSVSLAGAEVVNGNSAEVRDWDNLEVETLIEVLRWWDHERSFTRVPRLESKPV